jgi:lipopolysaccharide export system protein LptA
MTFTKVVFASLISLITVVGTFAQGGQPVQVSANTLQKGKYNGQDVRRLLGNVVMKQGTTTLTADSAYQYEDDANRLEVFSNVRIVQENMNATSATASYDGTKRIANMRGGVVLQDQEMTLTTPSLDYNLDAKRAYYTETGNIVGVDYTIKSAIGAYQTDSKTLSFKRNIVLVTKGSEVQSDTMSYNTVSKIVEFFGPTTVKSPDGTLYATRGTYNTVTRESNFRGGASIKTPEYLIKGEILTYDKQREYFTATQKVSMTSFKNNTVITGEVAKYWRAQGRSKIYGSPVMRNIMKTDTMYLSADTLYSVENVKDKTKKGVLYAYYGVRIFKSDLQGLSDSVTYNLNDSTIYMSGNPKLWANKSQLTADSVELQLANNTLHQMRLFGNAFAISQDTLDNYNQVKGRKMLGHFTDGKLRRIDVNGNGESIYFALQGDTLVTGLNRAVCSDMRMQFQNGQVESITFITDPEAKLIPPHELAEPDKRLIGFVWLEKEKPTRAKVLAKRAPAKPKPVSKPKKSPPAPKRKKAPAGRIIG